MEKYIRINQDGTSHFVTVYEEQRQVSEELLKKLSTNTQTVIKNMFSLGPNVISISMSKTEMIAVTKIEKLGLTSCFELGADKMLHPVFIAKQDAKSQKMPVISAEWVVPPSMTLVFAARIYDFAKAKLFTAPDASCYLMAFDSGKRAWRLPLPNLYDDCAICMGSFEGSGTTIQEAFAKALSQFVKSDWNSDLLGDNKQTNATKLFSFTPTKEGVETSPFTSDWTVLCPKIATPVSAVIGGVL